MTAKRRAQTGSGYLTVQDPNKRASGVAFTMIDEDIKGQPRNSPACLALLFDKEQSEGAPMGATS